ncbi:MAG: hypothetical protein QNK19_14990 [Xanthomonadales bacterium]|nr:hypothetical protein [Xanthomonadales bacterium]
MRASTVATSPFAPALLTSTIGNMPGTIAAVVINIGRKGETTRSISSKRDESDQGRFVVNVFKCGNNDPAIT